MTHTRAELFFCIDGQGIKKCTVHLGHHTGQITPFINSDDTYVGLAISPYHPEWLFALKVEECGGTYIYNKLYAFHMGAQRCIIIADWLQFSSVSSGRMRFHNNHLFILTKFVETNFARRGKGGDGMAVLEITFDESGTPQQTDTKKFITKPTGSFCFDKDDQNQVYTLKSLASDSPTLNSRGILKAQLDFALLDADSSDYAIQLAPTTYANLPYWITASITPYDIIKIGTCIYMSIYHEGDPDNAATLLKYDSASGEWSDPPLEFGANIDFLIASDDEQYIFSRGYDDGIYAFSTKDQKGFLIDVDASDNEMMYINALACRAVSKA